MKNHRYKNASYLSVFFAFLLGSGILYMTSCKTESETQNLPAPTIDRVAFIDSSLADIPVTATFPGTIIVIYGKNLSGTKQILMNGINAPFNSNYVLNTSIIVHIPTTVPTAATADVVANLIEVITDHGSTTTYFEFTQAPPSITKINNENTRVGGTMVLTGTNMYALTKIVFPGNISVGGDNFTASKDGTTLSVVVPANATQTGLLTVSGLFGNGFSPGPINARYSSSVFCNFDDKNTFNGKTGFVSNDSTIFVGGWQNYGQMKFGAVPANNYDYYTGGNGRSLQLISSRWVPTTDRNPQIANYAVKFEIFIAEPWKAGSIFLVATANSNYSARFSSPDPTNGFTTTGWITVTIPVTSFKLADGNGKMANGDALRQFSQLLDKSNASPLDLRFVNDDTKASESFNGAFDNIRVVRITPL